MFNTGSPISSMFLNYIKCARSKEGSGCFNKNSTCSLLFFKILKVSNANSKFRIQLPCIFSLFPSGKTEVVSGALRGGFCHPMQPFSTLIISVFTQSLTQNTTMVRNTCQSKAGGRQLGDDSQFIDSFYCHSSLQASKFWGKGSESDEESEDEVTSSGEETSSEEESNYNDSSSDDSSSEDSEAPKKGGASR